MAAENRVPITGLILAGGLGTRFWPLSRSQYPKQVLHLLGSESMIQATVERLLPRIPAERLAVVTNAAQAEIISLELSRKGWQGIRIILEPEGKNTAPAVGLAAVLLGAADPPACWRSFQRITLSAIRRVCWRLWTAARYGLPPATW